MLFWHLGGSLFLFRYLFRDPAVDVRFLMAGAVLPDLLDKPTGLVFGAGFFGTGRIFGHTLVFFAVLLAAVLLLTRRGKPSRKRWMALAVGVMFHLLLDGMWTLRDTLLWPFFGWEFPVGVPNDWTTFRWSLLAQESAGLAYLLWLWRRCQLSDPARRRSLLKTGVLPT